MHTRARTTYWLALVLMIGTTACAQRETAPGAGDAAVKVAVERSLAADPEVAAAASAITVVAHDGTVTLTGNVASEQQKREAEDVAEDVDGVASVENQLVVARANVPGAQGVPAAGAPGSAGR